MKLNWMRFVGAGLMILAVGIQLALCAMVTIRTGDYGALLGLSNEEDGLVAFNLEPRWFFYLMPAIIVGFALWIAGGLKTKGKQKGHSQL
jgi:hypothetical protein